MTEFLSFRKMITPIFIQVVFWIGVALCVIIGISQIVMGANSYGGGAVVLMGLITLVIGPLFVRIYCELLILLFRIHDELVAMRGALIPGSQPQGFPVMPVAPVAPHA
jgi:hypothetical protein